LFESNDSIYIARVNQSLKIKTSRQWPIRKKVRPLDPEYFEARELQYRLQFGSVDCLQPTIFGDSQDSFFKCTPKLLGFSDRLRIAE